MSSMLLRRIRARACQLRGDSGFSTLELVVITPFLLAFVLLVVGFGRVTHGHQLVEQAAAAAARAASLANTPGQATTDATREASDTLAQAGISCQSMQPTVDTSQFYAGGQVRVTITCVANLSDLTVVGFPGHKTLTASATVPLEQYRQFGGSG
ncbi:MAG: pilus assembly protein TadE [Pseudonocardiales bacterium]|nr:MAG: pilus assembly protein TadE [Pseudonocardiales bacterium]